MLMIANLRLRHTRLRMPRRPPVCSVIEASGIMMLCNVTLYPYNLEYDEGHAMARVGFYYRTSCISQSTPTWCQYTHMRRQDRVTMPG